MSSDNSYYDDYSEYELNNYDSESWPEPTSSPILEDESQMFHRDQLHKSQSASFDLPLPQISIPDPAIAICHSLDQSKQLIQKRFNIDPSSLRSHSIPGIVILSIKDINLIRKDTRNNRVLPHILVLPAGENFQLVHSDFAQCIQILNQ